MFRGARFRMRQIALTLCAVAMTIGAVSAVAAGKNDKVRWQNTMLVQVRVADLDRAIDFYTNTLGFTLQQRVDELQWARIETGIDNVIIGLGVGESAGSGTMSLNFGVGDIESARSLLESRGVVFDGPTLEIPGVVKLADFSDPDGNRIRLAGHSSSE